MTTRGVRSQAHTHTHTHPCITGLMTTQRNNQNKVTKAPLTHTHTQMERQRLERKTEETLRGRDGEERERERVFEVARVKRQQLNKLEFLRVAPPKACRKRCGDHVYTHAATSRDSQVGKSLAKCTFSLITSLGKRRTLLAQFLDRFPEKA